MMQHRWRILKNDAILRRDIKKRCNISARSQKTLKYHMIKGVRVKNDATSMGNRAHALKRVLGMRAIKRGVLGMRALKKSARSLKFAKMR